MNSTTTTPTTPAPGSALPQPGEYEPSDAAALIAAAVEQGREPPRDSPAIVGTLVLLGGDAAMTWNGEWMHWAPSKCEGAITTTLRKHVEQLSRALLKALRRTKAQQRRIAELEAQVAKGVAS